MGVSMYLEKCTKTEISKLQALSKQFVSQGEYDRIKLWITSNNFKAGDVVCDYRGLNIYVEGHDCHKIPSFTQLLARWRNSFHIHNWFVEYIQEDKDDCGVYIVDPESLEELLRVCLEVLEYPSEADGILPITAENFAHYVESLDELSDELLDELYDDSYFDDVRETAYLIRRALDDTDFESEMVIYHSNW